MRNQLLRDSDWSSMAHSLEVRVPLVDIKLFRTISRLVLKGYPPSKIDMANSVSIQLPTSVLQRPKTGFSIPVRDWLLSDSSSNYGKQRGLRGWAQYVYKQHS